MALWLSVLEQDVVLKESLLNTPNSSNPTPPNVSNSLISHAPSTVAKLLIFLVQILQTICKHAKKHPCCVSIATKYLSEMPLTTTIVASIFQINLRLCRKSKVNRLLSLTNLTNPQKKASPKQLNAQKSTMSGSQKIRLKIQRPCSKGSRNKSYQLARIFKVQTRMGRQMWILLKNRSSNVSKKQFE